MRSTRPFGIWCAHGTRRLRICATSASRCCPFFFAVGASSQAIGTGVALPKDQQRLTELLDAVEGPRPEQVLLQGSDEALGAAVPLGRPHEGRRTLDAQEGQLLLESIGHVLAPVIVPHGETACDLFGESAKAAPHALADRLERLEAGRPAGGMDADALG